MKAVIFDLFETLVTEWSHEKYTKRKMAADLNIPYEIFSHEWDSLHPSLYIGETDLDCALARIISKAGCKVDAETLATAVGCRIANKAEVYQYIHADIISMLDAIRADGCLLGLISNCTPEETGALKTCALYPFFDAVTLSCEVGCVKPDPKIYRLCCEKLGVSPWDCLFVGDGGSDELAGATRMGMKALQAAWFSKDNKPGNGKTGGFERVHVPLDVLRYLGEAM